MSPKILFPFSPGSNKVDLSFESELLAAQKAGFSTALLGAAALQFGGEIETKGVVQDDQLLFRGWILEDQEYASLEKSLMETYNAFLFQPSKDYAYTRDFPAWYRALNGYTPKSWYFPYDHKVELNYTWLADTLKAIWGRDGRPLLLKDYVKSRKQDWHKACYIPHFGAVEKVTKNFLEIQGEFMVGGLVYRQFMPFQKIGIHPKSRMPLINEWRQFYLDGKMFYQCPYWADGADYSKAEPNPYVFDREVARLNNKFLTVDVAFCEDGGVRKWMIVEINDGGSAGVPDGGNIDDFYQALKGAL